MRRNLLKNLLCVIFSVALASASSAAISMTMEQARQLLLRSGFTPTFEELSAMEQQELDSGIKRMVEQARKRTVARTPPPDWVLAADPFRDFKFIKTPGQPVDREEMRKHGEKINNRIVELMGWWMQEMLTTDAPLSERMTLFWHNHFACSAFKAHVPHLLYRQNVLFRQNALGNYRELLHAVARDPVMMDYLDSSKSTKDRPNENFARELLELFTLGEGHYSEKDIKEAARAFTGRRVKGQQAEFVLNPTLYDAGSKTLFGKTGNFNGEQVIDLVLDQPQAARFIIEKLWREFISPDPPAAAVDRLAAGFRKDWELAPLISALLLEAVSRYPANAGVLIKSPVEMVVGTFRFMKLKIGDPRMPALAAGGQGQLIFAPPNVKGWPGGNEWITSNTLLMRQQFVDFVTGESKDMGQLKVFPGTIEREYREFAKVNGAEFGRQYGAFAELYPPDGAGRFLALTPVRPISAGLSPQERMRSWLSDPAYQVK